MMNLKSWFERGALRCTSKEDATKWFEHEIGLVMAATGVERDHAEAVIKEHLGYASGYYSLEVAKRIYEFWGAEHPFFGTPEERSKYTAEELLEIGMAVGQIVSGNVEAEG
jgi:hypothetical protein